ncbi:MAG: NAD-dependent epimerase/dehydratase family protein [Nostocoides sp.]
MRLLLLGGTGFLGRAVAQAALSHGVAVTCLARGSAHVPVGADLVRADRDLDDALAAVAGQPWDALVDLSRQPGHVRRAVRDLTARRWVFISSASVYARFDRPEQGEDAELIAPLAGDVLTDMGQYGAAKVACEASIRASTDSWTIIRPGLIGGMGDVTGRSGYYPWRFAHPTGLDVLVPPDLTFPVSLFDVDDLATWVVTCALHRTQGVFNATGDTTTLGRVLQTARTVASSTAVPARSRRRSSPRATSRHGWAHTRCRCGSMTRRGAGSPR